MISALTPSITEAVKAALAGQSQTTVTITQQAQVVNAHDAADAHALHDYVDVDVDAVNIQTRFQPG